MELRLSGGRDVRATLDRSGDVAADSGPDGNRVVAACPPHPQMGGDRRDGRLGAVSSALTDRGIDCLRFDYGPWDEGTGEQTDARAALRWGRENYEQVGLFGYSFGGSIALLVAGESDDPPAAVSALAPASAAAGKHDVVGALDSITCPVQIVYGERDDTAAWEPVVDRARELGFVLEGYQGDHFFLGQQKKIAEEIAGFFANEL